MHEHTRPDPGLRPSAHHAPATLDEENATADTDDRSGDDQAVLVRFTAQAWIDDYAVTVDPQGPTTFRVPIADAQGADGRWLESHSDQSDVLRTHRSAPQWVQDWTGPFEIELEHVSCPATHPLRVPDISRRQTAPKGCRP
jgi:hypothetical protein